MARGGGGHAGAKGGGGRAAGGHSGGRPVAQGGGRTTARPAAAPGRAVAAPRAAPRPAASTAPRPAAPSTRPRAGRSAPSPTPKATPGKQPTSSRSREFKRGTPIKSPVKGTVGSTFGTRIDPKSKRTAAHKGVDIKTPVGSKVIATGPGKVIKAGWEAPKDHKKGYGLRVWIDHGGGNQSVYGHLSEKSVKVGDVVQRGQEIGKSGNSGKSTGPHLHYGEYYRGEPHEPTGRPDKFQPK